MINAERTGTSAGKLKAAMYLRISSEDSDIRTSAKTESDSIANQRSLLSAFISRTPELENADILEFCDDGWSGKNFDRPAVREMLEQARKGVIQCILVKDLSRFGRDYLEVGNYISRIFPFLGIRFIAVNDHFDSSRGLEADSLETSFKTLFHDIYSRDISRKVREAKRFRAQRGEFINSFAPYGYVKDPHDKKHLVIDPEAAVVIRRIFRMAVEKKNSTEIARALNADCVPTPMQYKKAAGCPRTWICAGDSNFWTRDTVNSILRDERYIGTNVFGRRMCDEIGKNHMVSIPRAEWIRVAGCHEGIVTDEEFVHAQENLREYKEYSKNGTGRRLLWKKVRCGVCGHIMYYFSGKKPYYICNTPRVTDGSGCPQERFAEEELLDALKNACIDPRFRYVTRGCAGYVEWLGQKENPDGKGWAAGAGYGEKILAILKGILGMAGGVSSSSAGDGGWYRVRKSWADASSQKGAFKSLENAKKCADGNPGHSVFDECGKAVYTKAAAFKPYLVRVTIPDLNIWKGPGTDYGKTGKYTGIGAFTIVEEAAGKGASRWGLLKSYQEKRDGWIYTGNLLLQRTYRENHITKKCIINHGEKPMYHATGTHEAIIDMDTFNKVQEEMKRRAEHFKHKEGEETLTYPFSGLVRCGCCGKNYIRSGAPTYRTWTCGTRRKEGMENCGADIIPEEELFRLTAEVLGSEVTEDAVRDKITAIRAVENRTLVFCLRNGKETVKQWKEHETVHVCTEEQKRQISLKNSGRKRTEEERRQQSERMKEYWKTHTFTEEQRRNLSEKKKEYWNDREASEAHRQKLSRLMKEMRAGNTGAGKEGQDG